MFDRELSNNYEQRFLITFVIDNYMLPENYLQELNKGFIRFCQEIKTDFVAQSRLEVCLITTDLNILKSPNLIGSDGMPLITASNNFYFCSSISLADEVIAYRKKWYKMNGLNYYRPMIVCISANEISLDTNTLKILISKRVEDKKFTFNCLISNNSNYNQMYEVCSIPPPLRLDTYRLSEFFKWLSNSITSLGLSSKTSALDFYVKQPFILTKTEDEYPSNEDKHLEGSFIWKQIEL